MNKVKKLIWGRQLNLRVYYKTFTGKGVTEVQEEALGRFMDSETEIDNAKENMMNYIIKNHTKELDTKQVDNIFKYVMPNTIFVSRSDNKRVVALLCDFKFDDDGLAIVFENEKFKAIVSQDEVL